MGYDLNFWRYRRGATRAHQAVYERLSEGERIEEVEDLPIQEIRAQIETAFSKGWTRVGADTWESQASSFQLFTTPQFVRIDCYGMNGDDMNRFIDILHAHRCPLYDPQAGRRFDDD